MKKLFSKGRYFGTHVEVVVGGEKKIMTPEEYKKFKVDRLKKKAIKNVSDKPKELAPASEIIKRKTKDE
jgi:hypothetical protein